MAKIDSLQVSVFKVPTDGPESDGTLKWDSTTLVVVEIRAGSTSGLGFTYASKSAGSLIQEELQSVVVGRDAMDVQAIWQGMVCSLRNLGRPGISAMAIAKEPGPEPMSRHMPTVMWYLLTTYCAMKG